MRYTQIRGYAKINLFLEVYEQNGNGYHDIDSVMQCVSLHDRVRVGFEETCTDGMREISVRSGSSKIPCDERNTAYKAAKIFMDRSGICGRVDISIEKLIPFSAGLGGGSADAAAVIIALNDLCNTGYTNERLCSIGASVGADVPFCIRKGCAICRGIGEIFTPCDSLPQNTQIVIAKGRQGSSTPLSFRKLDEIKNREIIQSSDETAEALRSGDIAKISKSLYNAFEKVVLPINREASCARRLLALSGASGVLMSGSGSAVFGLFCDEKKAQSAKSLLIDRGFSAFVCTPIQ